uniref:LAGLIDADG endonuclease n=1 Tax=Ganoderma calidophilum TaxID=2026244 RepID=A0A2S1WBL9_9APHY|nr:hypothetical protein [Ganoderma calidophilum]AWJ63983.1 hypothetical protein [Ganoderma calidophilum]
MNNPRIPITPIITLVTSLGYATHNASQAKKTAAENHSETIASNEELKNKLDQEQDSQEAINEGINELKSKVSELAERVETLEQSSSEVTQNTPVLKSSSIPSWDEITQFFSSIDDYIRSIPLENALALSHLALLLTLIYILFLVFINSYSNYLIEHYQLKDRFPRLKFLFELKLNYSRFYLAYLLSAALFLMVYYVIIDILILLD